MPMFGRCVFLVVWLKTATYSEDLTSYFSYFLVKRNLQRNPKIGRIFDIGKYANRLRSQKGASLIGNFFVLVILQNVLSPDSSPVVFIQERYSAGRDGY